MTLAAWLLATGPIGRSIGKPSAMTRARMLVLAFFGAAGVWFSYPLAFSLAALGILFIAQSALAKRWRQTLGFLAMSLVWAASFAVCYKVSHGILSKDRFIWDWWDFAFLPIPPRSLEEVKRVSWQVLNLFNSPAGVLTPLGVLPSAFLALGLFVVGAFVIGRRSLAGLFLVLAPLPFVMLASALHQYPFHGRLLIFLVPTVHLLAGEGAAALTRKRGAPLALAIGAFLLLQPAFDVMWHRMILPRLHTAYDSHGDLVPDLLDHLEKREWEQEQARRDKQSRDKQRRATEMDSHQTRTPQVPP